MLRAKKSPLRATSESCGKENSYSPANLFGRRSTVKTPKVAPETPPKSQREFQVQHHSPGMVYPSSRVYTPETPQKDHAHPIIGNVESRRVIAPIRVPHEDYGFTRKRKSLSVRWIRARQHLRESTGLDIEALHVIARPLMIAAGYAPEAATNLVLGTRQANSSMMSFENALQRLIKKEAASPWIWATVYENQAGLGNKLTLFVSLDAPGDLSDKGKPLDPQCRYYQISFNLQLTSEPALASETYCYQTLKDKFFSPKPDALAKPNDPESSSQYHEPIVKSEPHVMHTLERNTDNTSVLPDKLIGDARPSHVGLFSTKVRRKLNFADEIVVANNENHDNQIRDCRQ